jgi:cell fate (sporulation/competence/biofilm development) regulator YlbF (YheA/YmcA/DUF963 family)
MREKKSPAKLAFDNELECGSTYNELKNNIEIYTKAKKTFEDYEKQKNSCKNELHSFTEYDRLKDNYENATNPSLKKYNKAKEDYTKSQDTYSQLFR